jgi:2-oxoisovalerate dehydrogenase E2 component (dihydrolipoyl transacylase)
MTQMIETTSLMDDADIESWWTEDADITGRLVAAIAIACAAVPALNSRYDPDRQCFEPLSTVDLGIAIEADKGVRVPVFANVVHMPITEIRHRLDRLHTVIEDGSPRPSVTLVNFGRGPCRYASLPVVPPQVAVVAAGRVQSEPVHQDGRIILRHRLPLTLTYDTRATGLLGATRFLGAMKADLALRDLPLTRGSISSARPSLKR